MPNLLSSTIRVRGDLDVRFPFAEWDRSVILVCVVCNMQFTFTPWCGPAIQGSSWDHFDWYTSTPPSVLCVNQDHVEVAVRWRMSLYIRIVAWLHYKEHTTVAFSRRVLNEVLFIVYSS